MIHPTLHRVMTRLALASMLLLALVPTTGRMLAARADVGATLGWAELCTAEGLKRVPLGALPDAGHGVGEDCDYCPLLQATVVPGPALLVVAPQRAFPGIESLAHPAPRLAAVRTGLGSRGPPRSA